MRSSTKQHWDKFWSKEKKRRIIHKLQFQKMKKVLKNLRNKKVLEVGAGSGIDSLYLAKKYKTRTFCLDFSEKSLEMISKNFKTCNLKCRIIKADLRKIPFRDNYFDIVFSNGVLEHFKNPLQVILEQKRVLKKGGLLVIGVPYKYTFYTLKKMILILLNKWYAGWETQFTKRELLNLIQKAKMKCLDIYYDCHPRWYLPKKLQGTWLNFFINGGVVVFALKI
jgi:ubiquinone/menaquinone biosynthesis C-methylase UbiE